MSDKKEPCPDPEDEDLTKLLDSALGDFGRARTEGGEVVEGGEASGIGVPVIDQAMAQQAAQEFQNMLKQLADVQKVVLEQHKNAPRVSNPNEAGLGPVAAAAAAAGLTDAPMGLPSAAGKVPSDGVPITSEEESAFAESLLTNLQGLAEKAKKVTEASGEDEFLAAMEDMHKNDSYTNEFLPFMQGLMGSLLSKEMMYPSLKEMVDKYPKWLEEHAEGLKPDDKERYEAQLSLMKEAVTEYDAEKEDDSDEVAAARFEKLIVVMQKMQLCGHPPEELVGAMPPGWALSDKGLPQVTDPGAAAEACSLM